jgi:copper(I)-binding protein
MQNFQRLALDRPAGGRRRFAIVTAAAVIAAVLGFMPSDLEAQGQLPLPVPGTPPATTPETPPGAPGAPGAPGEDARARAAAMAAKANIDVTDAWTKATTPNTTTAQIYLHLVSAKDPDRLIGLEVSNATRIDVREATDQGAAKGTAAPSVDVPAGGTVNFAPGGRHLLLTGLKAPLREGDSFLVTFRFDKGGSQAAVVKILGANASGPPAATAARSGDTTAGATAR